MKSAKRKNTTPVERTSADLVGENVERLKELFPEAVAEGKVDFEKLKTTLGEIVDDRPERYSFTWAGKRDAVRILQVPSRATLKPCTEESVEWENTRNVFIEGENLEVLKLLYKSYSGRVKMIYIDPPYNTGNDFIYTDNFADPLDTYLKLTNQKDAEGNLLTSNPETSGRYHSAWLSMMYPRLFVARQLLCKDGVIFVSIDDNEVHNLRLLMDSLYGAENFVTTVIWQKVFSPKNTAKYFSEDHDYVVLYARNINEWLPRLLPRTDTADARYKNPDNDSRGPWSSSDLTARNYYSEGQYTVTSPAGKQFGPGLGRYWRSSYEKFLVLDKDDRIWWGPDGNNMPRLKRFLTEVREGIVPQTLWKHEDVGNTQEAKKELLEFVNFRHTENVLNTVKPTRLIQRMIQIATEPDEGDIILDFFAGSGATAHAVTKQNNIDGGNRIAISVQIPEALPKPEKDLSTIADMAKQRFQNVRDKLAKEREGKLDFSGSDVPQDIGFRVFKLTQSNYRQWHGVADKDSEKYAEEMELFTDPLLSGWKPEDVVWEVALKEGYSLSSTVEQVKGVKGNRIWHVTDPDRGRSFQICLDDKLKDTTVKALKLGKEDLFVCRDAALTDQLAANLALTCKLKTI